MIDCIQNVWTTVVAGLGSPFGDDRAGWRVIEKLRQRTQLPARLILLHEATQLIEQLAGCRRLIVVDACRSRRRDGEVTRLEWPDPRIAAMHSHSTHGVGLASALQLAERLGRLPARVEIIGIEIGNFHLLDEMSPDISESVAKLAETLSAELSESIYARTLVG
jgi:hydrogenase maturation protease